jgi:hypothetical protein
VVVAVDLQFLVSVVVSVDLVVVVAVTVGAQPDSAADRTAAGSAAGAAVVAAVAPTGWVDWAARRAAVDSSDRAGSPATARAEVSVDPAWGPAQGGVPDCRSQQRMYVAWPRDYFSQPRWLASRA